LPDGIRGVTKIRIILAAIAVAAVAIVLLISTSTVPSPPVAETPNPTPAPDATAPRVADVAPPVMQPTPARTSTPNPRLAGSPLAKELNAPTSDATRDVATLHGMLRQYLRQLHQRPGHPIGNDADLARVLTGQNPMKLVVLPPTHPALSPDGRLRDRWGTPYFIHPRGHGAFEIRSAGPDRKLFTGDDAIANPPPGRTELVEAALLGDVPEP
jgi:hypothetical protein